MSFGGDATPARWRRARGADTLISLCLAALTCTAERGTHGDSTSAATTLPRGGAAGLAEGQVIRKGDVLGYVGTTGNAPPNVPHLHFAISRTADVSKWWRGTPLDPRPISLTGTHGR